MKAGKKLFSQALSSSVLMKSSMGVTASSSISVNMSVESSTEVVGGLPLLWAVIDDRFLIGTGIDRLHLDAGVILLEFTGIGVNQLCDWPADGNRVVEGDFRVALSDGRSCQERSSGGRALQKRAPLHVCPPLPARGRQHAPHAILRPV